MARQRQAVARTYTPSADERETLVPPYDPAAFARSSQSRLAALEDESPTAPRSSLVAELIEKIGGSGDEEILIDEETLRGMKHKSEVRVKKRPDRLNLPLPTLDQVPYVNVSTEDLAWYELEDAAHVLIQHIDGESDLQRVVTLTGVPVQDAFRILGELATEGIVLFR